MILEGLEYETIWKVAHKWDNKTPDSSTAETLTIFVKDRLMLLARAGIKQKISLHKFNNLPVLDTYTIVNMIFEWKLFWSIRDTYYRQKYR